MLLVNYNQWPLLAAWLATVSSEVKGQLKTFWMS